MSILARIKAAFSNERWLESTMTVLRGEEAKRAPFSQQAAVSAYRSWVYAAANLNAVSVASQPLRLYVKNRSAGTKLWNTRKASRRVKAYMAGDLEQLPSRYVMSKAAEYGNDFEVVEDSHPILTLLSKVNPYQNGFDATILRILFLELTGNSYLHPVIDKRLKIPVELWTMPSQYVEIVPGKEQFIDGYLYGATREQRRVFTPEEVIHFKRPNPGDMYYGLGKVEAAWGATMANEAVHEMDHAFFANKARPDYLLVVKSPAHPDEIERLEVQIDEKLRGSKRSGRFLTTTGDIDLKPLSFPPKDLAGRTEIVEEIAAVFGVPVSMLKANDPNLASATVGFASWKATTILPLLRMDEETLNQNLLPLFGIEEDAFLAYDNPVSEDERFEFEKIRSMVAGGIITVNEARMREGLEAVEDPMADSLLVNGQPLGGAPPAPPSMGLASATNPPDGLVGPLDTAPDLDEPPEPQPERKDALSDCVSEKVAKLIAEGYPQDQAVAIAYSMCAEGKSIDDSAASLGIEKKAIGDIDTRPPQGVADNARRALDVRARKPESERGMTPVGIARARDLMNRSRLSEDTIRRMLAYFERHEVDKEGSTWDEQGRGWQAWNGWGGDDGFAWARRKVEEFNRERERKRLGKSCGCRSNSTTAAKVEFKDCGTGAGGFQSGNTCGEEEGDGDGQETTSSSRSTSERMQLNFDAIRNAESLPPQIGESEVSSYVEKSEVKEITSHVTKPSAAGDISTQGFKVIPSDDPRSNISFGRVWGDGVYLGMDQETQSFYEELGSSSGAKEVLKTVVDVRNPLRITYTDQADPAKGGASSPENILKAAGLDDAVKELDSSLKTLAKKSQDWTDERRRLIRETVDPFVPKESETAWKVVQEIPDSEIPEMQKLGFDEFNRKLEEKVREKAGDQIASALFAKRRLIEKIEQDPAPPNAQAFATAFVTRKLVDSGFDSIIVENKGNLRASGGNQVVVFDPKRIKVVK